MDKKKHKNKNCLVSRQTTAAREGEHSLGAVFREQSGAVFRWLSTGHCLRLLCVAPARCGRLRPAHRARDLSNRERKRVRGEREAEGERGQMVKGGEREAPDAAGRRLQAQLDDLCPCVQPAPHPRGFPVSRNEVEELCADEAERARLHQVPTTHPNAPLPCCASALPFWECVCTARACGQTRLTVGPLTCAGCARRRARHLPAVPAGGARS